MSCSGLVWGLCASFLLMAMVRGQKRSAVADLEMLVAEPSAFGNPELYHRTGDYEKLVDLSDTLKRLQELQRFYSHQGRTR